MSYDIVQESVPAFIRRVGDYVFQGSNNTLLVLGTDRAKTGPASINDGLGSVNSAGAGKGTGSILMVVGRKDKDGNPDLSNDSATLYLSMKTDGDKNLGTTQEGDDGLTAYGILTADAVRLKARKTIKVVAGSGYVYLKEDKFVTKIGNSQQTLDANQLVLDVKKILCGKDASLGAVLVDKLVAKLSEFINVFNQHQHVIPGPSGNTGIPLAPATPPSISDLASKRTFVDAG